MKNVVVDANVCLNWFLPTEHLNQTDYAQAFLAYIRDENVLVHVPAHFEMEVSGTLLKVFRSRGRGFTEKSLNTALDIMDAMPLNVHGFVKGYAKITALARAYNLSMYDTPYMNLARALDCPIATRDRGLISAAKAWRVEVWQA
ncbi:MAG: type II toxin-antitoxin system VapC family toxin [Pseudomonadota bacterium]